MHTWGGQEPVGLIGIGSMGAAMARRLLAADIGVTVWARRAEAATELLAAGATWADSPQAVGTACRVVITCVTDTAAVDAVVFGDGGLAAAEAHADAILLDHSTINPARTRELGERLAAHGRTWVDAPVTGGVAGVEAGTLVIMAGGPVAAVEAIRPLTAHYSARLTHLGSGGCGQAAKTVNQMLIGAHVAVTAEALHFAANFGVDAGLLPDALGGGWGDSAVLQNHARRMVRAEYPDIVPAALMAKDIDIACEMGRATGSAMPITAQVQQMYRKLIAEGHDDKGQIGLMWLHTQDPL